MTTALTIFVIDLNDTFNCKTTLGISNNLLLRNIRNSNFVYSGHNLFNAQRE